jgi:phosphate-selective porin OprO/OprP
MARRLAGPLATVAAIAIVSCGAPAAAFAQGSASPQVSGAPATNPTITETIDAAESDGDMPEPILRGINEYELKRFSLRWGGGVLWDYAAYDQTEASEQQMALSPKTDLRDFRLLFKGKLPIPHVTYTVGYMYDKAKDDWRFRQTGIMVDIPRLHGNVFVGRTKEGFSTNKIMVGYQGFTNERATMNDALIPILADGIKWSGTIPNGRLVYNIGFFADSKSESESFNKHDKHYAMRAVWLPLRRASHDLVHIAVQWRHALPDDGLLQYRSKPESFQAQEYAIDTGRFEADHANSYGVETYYRRGPLIVGTEYFITNVKAPASDNPSFHGGEVLATYILTGETRPYNARGAYFERVTPARSVFNGGPGAWELVGRFSYSDLDSGPIRGGTFWRFTPMVNWHLSGNVRLEFVYGYSSLDRLDLVGKTHYFQSRLQFQL